MKWKTFLTLSLAGAALIGVVALVTTSEHEDAAGFYASYHQRSHRSGMSVDQRLGALDLALELARTEGLPELQRAILSERVNLLLEMGAYGRSREDFRRLEELGELDLGQRSARARMELLAGDLETAQTLSAALVESAPEDAQAHALKGRVERELARVEEAGAQRSIENELIDEVGRAAIAHLRELCGREPQDVRRVAQMHELQALFGPRAEALTEAVLAAGDRASRANSAALQSYARSLRLEYRAEHLAAYAELLAGAGETERALNLCTLAWADAQTRSNLPLSEFLLRELARLERWRFGNLVASDWIEKGGAGSVALYSDAARIAYGSLINPDAEPIRVFNAGNRLGEILPIGVSRLPLLYTGTAFHRFGTRGNEELARIQLARYLSDEEPEPFKGARASAYRALADSCRALGLQSEERAALEGAVELDPNGRGEDWLRLSELERGNPHGGARLPDEYLAHAITLLPDRAADLTREWRQQGESQLKLIGFDEQAVRTALAGGKRPELSVAPTPYEIYRLAELSFEAKATARAQEFLRLLLAAIPGFPPALDLELAIQTQRGRPAEVVTVLLQRLERSGIDARLRTQVAALPPEVLTGEVRRRLCLADPEGFGRLSLAENAREAHKGLQALQALRAVPAELLTIQAQLEVAQLELEFGDPVAAFALMDPLAEQWMALPGAFELYSRIAIRIDDLNALEKQLRVFVRDVPLERARLMALAREWVARGASQPALLLCVTLDRAGKEFRGKELLLLQAACEAGLNRRDALALSLGRLEAVDTAGRAELMGLCARQEGNDDEEWRALADTARAAGWKPSPLLAAALNRSLGSAVATEALPEPYRQLLVDGEDALARRFLEFAGVRGLFVCLAALEEPLIAPQAHALLSRVQAAGEHCWSGWLRSQLLLRGKFEAAARSELEGVTRANAAFTPAWTDRMSLAGAQRSELRAQWAATEGAAPLPALEREILAADQALARGDAASALLAADAALALDARSAEALELRARALGKTGSKEQAAAAWFALYAVRPPAAGDASLAAALEDCRGDKALLDPLQKLAPSDPRIVLALAEQDIAQSGQATSFAAGRAFDRLDRFLASHPQGLDELAPGSAEAWARLLLRLDPARAQALLDRELDKDPGNVEAWRLMARVRAERGEIQPALRDIVTLQRMSPSVGLLMEYMRVRSLMDWTVDGVRGVAQRIASAPDAPKPGELLALESEALLHLGPAGLPALRELHAGDKALDATLAADARARLLWARLCSQETEDKATLELLAREWPGARDRGILGVAAGILRAARP